MLMSKHFFPTVVVVGESAVEDLYPVPENVQQISIKNEEICTCDIDITQH